MEAYINNSLAAGLILPSSSPACAGFYDFLFWKRKSRPYDNCTNYRGLNDITINNCSPLPLISSPFDLLEGLIVFTKLDLCNAYHLVRIQEGDEWKTALNTPTRHYEYFVLPFGLTNTPAVFQCKVNNILRDLLNCYFLYTWMPS